MQAETSYPAIVGRVLEARRKERGLDQAAVAQHLGLTQSAWSRMERGQSGLSLAQLVKVSDLLTLLPHEVLADADKAKEGLAKQGITIHSHVVTKPSDAVAFIALAALGVMIVTILMKK